MTKLSVRDAANMLEVPVATVLRWIRQGRIPAREVGGAYFFDDTELRRWARQHNMYLREGTGDRATQDPSREAEVSLHDAMKRGGIFYDVRGKTVEEVLGEAVRLAPLPPAVDRALLLDRLIQRERLASTGIGEGVAIPHPRYPLEDLPDAPMVTTCLLANEIDFGAVDKRPVFVVFLMLSSNTKMHLHLLARLSFCLRNETFLSMLRRAEAAERILETVKELESALDRPRA